jgi:hypothetical protein
MSERDRADDGVFSVRFGPTGSPDRDALEALEALGAAAKPVPVNRNQMIRLAVREYVERHSAAAASNTPAPRRGKGKK